MLSSLAAAAEAALVVASGHNLDRPELSGGSSSGPPQQEPLPFFSTSRRSGRARRPTAKALEQEEAEYSSPASPVRNPQRNVTKRQQEDDDEEYSGRPAAITTTTTTTSRKKPKKINGMALPSIHGSRCVPLDLLPEPALESIIDYLMDSHKLRSWAHVLEDLLVLRATCKTLRQTVEPFLPTGESSLGI